MKYHVIIFTILTATYGWQLQAAEPIEYQRFANQMVEDHFVVGLIGSVLENNEFHDFSVGLSDREQGVEVTDDTVFALGSASKVFTATLLAREVVLGHLDLNQTVDSILTELEGSAVGDIPLWELASHVSGLPRNPSGFAPDDPMDPYQHYDRPIFFQYLQNAKIGEKKYLYSNVGYGILTQILEHVTGYSYRDMIERYIAQPLNTPDILGGWGQTTAGRSAKKYSAILKEKPVWSTLNALAGSGDIKISLRALKKWMYYQVNPDRAPYPLNESIKLTQMAQHHDPAGFNIGLAWFQDIFNNILYYNHNGSTEGFTIELLYDLNHKRALIYVSNTDTYYPGLCLTDMFTGEGCDPVWTSMPKSISAYLGWYEIGDGDHREPNSPMEIYESPFAPIFVVEVEDAPPYRLLYNYEDKVFYTENDRFTIEFDSYTGGTIIESTREGDFKYDFVRQYKIAKRSESRKIPY